MSLLSKRRFEQLGPGHYSYLLDSSVSFSNQKVPACVAQLDVRPTGNQEVACSTLAVSATFFCGD